MQGFFTCDNARLERRWPPGRDGPEIWREGAAARWRIAVEADTGRIDVACFAKEQRPLSLLVRQAPQRKTEARAILVSIA